MALFRRWLVSSFASIALVTLVQTASAGVVINVVESGGNVVATLSGSLSYLGIGTPNAPSGYTGAGFVLTAPDAFGVYKDGTRSNTAYAMTGPLSAWGTPMYSTPNSFNLTGTDHFEFYAGSTLVLGPYNVGDTINGSLTFNSTTLAAMGLTNPGSYVYTVGSGSDTDTITFNIGGGGAAVPEPSSLAIFSIAAATAAIRARRKAKARA